jgi:hypothetical protein
MKNKSSIGPRTLAEAHMARAKLYPGPGASPDDYETYSHKAASIYQRVASIDGAHENEARWWASDFSAEAERYREKREIAQLTNRCDDEREHER